MIAQLTPEWHEARKKLITASEFAAAMGLSPYMSRQKLWRIKTGREEREPGNAYTAHGNDNEARAILDYEILTGNIVERSGLVIHPDIDWIGGSPDGLVGKDIVIEAKCPVKGLYPDIPEYYMPQVQGVMMVTDRGFGHFFAWFEGGLRVWEVRASNVYCQIMYDFLAEFRHCIDTDTQPPRAKKPIMPEVEYEVIYG